MLKTQLWRVSKFTLSILNEIASTFIAVLTSPATGACLLMCEQIANFWTPLYSSLSLE